MPIPKDKDIVEKIEDLVIRSNKFEQLQDKFTYFCPFEAMGMTDQEIRHAHFLSYILDPKRPHGFEDAYLRAFLHAAAESYTGDGKHFRPIDIHFANLTNTRIVRERDRVDLRIELNRETFKSGSSVVLIFELKIKAMESRGQLQSYVERMMKSYPTSKVIFFFLTLNGQDAAGENKENWTPISLSDVVSKFEKVSLLEVGQENAQQVVKSYIKMMGRRHEMVKNDELAEIARQLWADHTEVLEFLMSMQPDDVSNVLSIIFESQLNLCEKLSTASGLVFQPDIDSRQSEIVLFPSDWDEINKDIDDRRLLVLIIDRNYGDRDTIRLRWLLRRGDVEKRREIYDRISGKKRAFSNTWTQIAVERFKLEENTSPNDLEDYTISFVLQRLSEFSSLNSST